MASGRRAKCSSFRYPRPRNNDGRYEGAFGKLRIDAEDCALISKLATDMQKRELFARLAEHLGVLASEVERAMAAKMAGGDT
jgi:hypothetical protein